MALISKQPEPKVTNQKIKITEGTWQEVEQYMEYAELAGDSDLFFEEAAKFTMKKDKDFQAWKKEQAKKGKGDATNKAQVELEAETEMA